jgi:arsenite methyltransferase
LPVGPARIDVVTSNCVLNLVPNKEQAFREIFRVLKPGGRFSISDIVLKGTLPANVQNAAEMIAGCVSGAMQESDYLSTIHRAGFDAVSVQKERVIDLPDSILEQYISKDEIASLRASGAEVKSITVTGVKPAGSCGCGTDCC